MDEMQVEMMEEKQLKTLARVIKKLNALRATMTASEQAMLDGLILGAPAPAAEVQGHDMKRRGVVARGAVARGAVARGAVARGAVARGAVAEMEAEVEGHDMKRSRAVARGAVARGAVARGAAVARQNVVFNADKDGYEVVMATVA